MNVFLVHGTMGKPFENWFPWLENRLAEKNICCNIPTFPTPAHQNYADWEKLMDFYCDLGVVNGETILIGHSCGAVFLVHYLLEHKIHVRGLICVSGYNNFISGFEMMDKLNESFYMNAQSIDVTPYADTVIGFYGDDDPNIPQRLLNDFATSIGGEVNCVPNAGHFNASAGYLSCPAVLDAVIRC